MGKCPECGSIQGYCEEVDLVNGEVTGYHCTKCGYESTDETSNE